MVDALARAPTGSRVELSCFQKAMGQLTAALQSLPPPFEPLMDLCCPFIVYWIITYSTKLYSMALLCSFLREMKGMVCSWQINIVKCFVNHCVPNFYLGNVHLLLVSPLESPKGQDQSLL